jgi:S-adenosylmethionine-diacylglycerol 3-amino-3-carboxypropyl transferase
VQEILGGEPAASVDAYVLLDAQDWMGRDQLNALWSQITRTARPGARVIFRTAGADSPLVEALEPDILGRWRYEADRSRALLARDRSAIYGGFHLYVRSD